MSLLRDKWITEKTRLLVYEANPPLESQWLAAHSSKQINAIYQSFHLEKRKWEWLSVQLLREYAGIEEEIMYRHNGQPFLPGSHHISISHGDGLAGLLISETGAGLDIQKPDLKLHHISKKFCNQAELDFALNSSSPLEYLTVLWCAKEAVFKVFGENVHFARDIRVDTFSLNDSIAKATCVRNRELIRFNLHSSVVNSHRLVCTM